ncbi:hypothetical protein Bbelb_344780 [Branchiostoma belcheri]|nr:hypothetical protein Bbelb_344780 [Branchiostoma belcheri]
MRLTPVSSVAINTPISSADLALLATVGPSLRRVITTHGPPSAPCRDAHNPFSTALISYFVWSPWQREAVAMATGNSSCKGILAGHDVVFVVSKVIGGRPLCNVTGRQSFWCFDYVKR